MKTTISAMCLAKFKRSFFVGTFLFVGILGIDPQAASAGTPAGTAISNTASISYSDGNGTSFVANSNTVTTTVASVPSITVTAGPSGNTVPGGQYTATFTFTNSGNGNGSVNLIGGTGGGADYSYLSLPLTSGVGVAFPASAVMGTIPVGCTLTGPKTYACIGANILWINIVAGAVIAPGTSIVMSVPYLVAANAPFAAAGVDYATVGAPATITYAAANNPGTTGSTTSAASSASQTENVIADSRLDMTKSVLQPNATGNSTAFLAYTINASNGGMTPAVDLPAVKTLLGSPSPGILITDKVPSFAGTPLLVQSVSATTTGANVSPGAAATIYSTTSATGTSGWSARTPGSVLPAGTTFVGVLLSGGANGVELLPNNNTTTEGNVTTANADVVLTLLVSPPSGVGSGNANSVVNEANSVIGGNNPNPAPVTGIPNVPLNVNGPGIAAASAATQTALATGSQGILYPTQAAGFVPTTFIQNGTSNAVGARANNASAVFDGPFGSPEAVGSYNGTVAASNLNDVTALSYLPTGFVPTNTSSTAVVGNAVGATSTVTVPNTIENVGNQVDNLTVSIAAPTGWGVQIFAATSAGVATGTALAGTTSSNTASYTFTAVPSGLSTDTTNKVNYAVTYTLPATATAFSPYDVVNTVTSVNDGTTSNTTHNDLIPGGPIALIKTQTLDTTTCPGGSAVPGCIITYNVKYVNNAEVPANCPATPPASVPSFMGGFYGKGLTITEDGTKNGNTWGTTYSTGGTNKNTTGLSAIAVDTINASTTFPTGNTIGSTAFTSLLGGASSFILAPGCSGNLKFSVTINNQ